jgi:sulfate transport system ATP-binding protein
MNAGAQRIVPASASTSIPPKVAILGLHQHYGRFPALFGVDLAVRKGEFLALLGPSGSGKTTLLRTIAGLEPNYEGILSIDGEDMRNRPARLRNIGFMFQSYALFRHMTVAENVAFGLRVQKRIPDAAIRDRVRELLGLVQLPELSDRYPGQISGGQRQRVALARALATEPRLLLLDEPFGALDPLVRKELRQWLRALHERLGLTSIFVTHDQEEAIELADRIVLLNKGVIQQIGPPEQLEAQPINGFVFGFLGETVRFPGLVRDGVFRFATEQLAALGSSLPDGAAEMLTRPYHIQLTPEADGPGVVTGVHPAGPLWRHGVKIGEMAFETLAFRALNAGARVGVRFERANLFEVQ